MFRAARKTGCESPRGRIRQAGADYLAYALLDAVIDSYFPVLEEFGERLDRLDDDLNTRTAGRVIAKIHDARSELLLLRRTMWPHREAVNQLIRDPQHLIGDETRIYLRDCYDNVVQAIELVETYRELCADLRDECLSFISNRLNEIMKVLTIIATIFMPLSFIASLYGMNFNTGASPWNMPELNWRYGYPFVLAIMAAVVVVHAVFLPPPRLAGENGCGGRETRHESTFARSNRSGKAIFAIGHEPM